MAVSGIGLEPAMVDEFVAAIRENRSPAITGYDGYKGAGSRAGGLRGLPSARAGGPAAGLSPRGASGIKTHTQPGDHAPGWCLI